MKKKMAFIAAVVLAALSIPAGSISAAEYINGDVDMDGKITGRDAAIVSQYADGILKLELTGEQLRLADMNGDGTVDSADAELIAKEQVLNAYDINCDGAVNLSDAVIVVRMTYLNKIDSDIDFSYPHLADADVDCNGIVDIYDAYTIMEHYVRQGAMLPIFDDEKYYIVITPEMEQEILNKDTYVLKHPEANIRTLKELYNLKWNVSGFMDVDGDKVLSVSDSSVILQVYAESASGTSSIELDFDTDVNLDGKTDISDATLILKAYAMNAAGLL